MILSTIYGSSENTREKIDVYTSLPWSGNVETKMNQIIFPHLKETNYRFIGDALNQPSYDKDKRIKKIMNTCGGFIGILPLKEGKTEYGCTSKYILDEIKQAEEVGLDGILFADNRVDKTIIEEKIPKKYKISYINIEEKKHKNIIETALEKLESKKRRPRRQHVFFATNLCKNRKKINEIIMRLSGTVTATPCVIGENIEGYAIQHQISEKIRHSYVMIADISGEDQCDNCKSKETCSTLKKGKDKLFRLNTCIEAGIARGAHISLYLVAKGNRQSPPFMFRDMEIQYYDNDCELLAIVHKILRHHRRRVITLEEILEIAEKEEQKAKEEEQKQ